MHFLQVSEISLAADSLMSNPTMIVLHSAFISFVWILIICCKTRILLLPISATVVCTAMESLKNTGEKKSACILAMTISASFQSIYFPFTVSK